MKKLKLFLILFLALFININNIKADLEDNDSMYETPILDSIIGENNPITKAEINNTCINFSPFNKSLIFILGYVNS